MPETPKPEKLETSIDEYEPGQWRKLPVVVTAQRMREPFVCVTMEGELAGKAGDWLMTGVRGEQYPCDDGVFRQTYEAAHLERRSPESTEDDREMAREVGEAYMYERGKSYDWTRRDAEALFILGRVSMRSPDETEYLRKARVHIVRQQHAGNHEQDRYDAREWLKQFEGKACCCKRCLKLEGRADLAEAVGLDAEALAALGKDET